jgi:hypothetical protein
MVGYCIQHPCGFVALFDAWFVFKRTDPGGTEQHGCKGDCGMLAGCLDRDTFAVTFKGSFSCCIL